MKLIVISPENEDPREIAVLTALFAGGLELYHVRKPFWSREKLHDWLQIMPAHWRQRMVLHQHHDLVDTLKLAGAHWRDDGSALLEMPAISESPFAVAEEKTSYGKRSRSCHELATLRQVLGSYDTALLGPIFPSISKAGYAPTGAISLNALYQLLRRRSERERKTEVVAMGGITVQTAPRCRDFGFDGIATLGAVWKSADPVRSYFEIQASLHHHVS